MWQLRCIATWGHLKPRQSFSSPLQLRHPCQVWSRSTCRCCLVAFSLMLYCDLDLWPFDLTHDLWPWAFVVYWLWCDQTLYQIWAKSKNLQQSYWDFNIWPNNLEHVSHVSLHSGIIFTKFELSQPIRSWLTTFLLLLHYVTLCLRPWTFVVHVTWSKPDLHLSEIE